MSKIPWKTIFAIGFIAGFVTVVAAVTFAPGDAGQVSDGVPYGAPSGMNATIQGDTNVIMESDVLYPSSDTVDIRSEDGNITFQSSGPAWATVATNNITGTYTNVTDIDATSNDITINPEDKQSITVGGNIDHVAWRDTIAADDNNVDFRYGGTSGTADVTVNGVSGNAQIAAIDQQSTAVLGVATSTAGGQLSYTGLPQSSHSVTLQTSDGGPTLSNASPNDQTFRTETVQLSVDVSDPDLPNDNVTLEWFVDGNKQATTYATSAGTYTQSVTLSDGQYNWHVEATDAYSQTDSSSTSTFTINHYNPQITNIQPTGDLDSDPTQISADVSDADFGNDGDTLTVDIRLDGSQISSQTINSNQTITTSMPSSGRTGGSHNIQINVTDSYGKTTTGSSSYGVPNTFFVRNETNHSQLIPADGEVRFYGDDEVFTRTTSNGQFDMTGLPVNQNFIVEVVPSAANFTNRTVYVQSIYEQQSAYVLNTSLYPTVTSRFTLNDPTGTYDSNDVLSIRRPINISGNVTYQSIKADRFGAEGVTASLQNNTRYRLVVIGEDSQQKVGVYRALISENVEVSPGTAQVGLNQTEQGYAYGANLDNRTLAYQYSDPQNITDQLIVYIHEPGNPTLPSLSVVDASARTSWIISCADRPPSVPAAASPIAICNTLRRLTPAVSASPSMSISCICCTSSSGSVSANALSFCLSDSDSSDCAMPLLCCANYKKGCVG